MIELTPEMAEFVRERHLAALTLVRPDGRPHVTPVGFTWDRDLGMARVITWNGSLKARLLDASGPLRAAICQIDGGRWATLEGKAVVSADAERCRTGVERYAERYSQPKDRGLDRRVIEIVVDRVLGRA